MRSHLVEGTVRHRRTRPFVYALEHSVFYLALDLAELDRIGSGAFRLLGRNRWRPLTFRDDDHWLPPASDLRASVLAHLRTEGFADALDTLERWQITLVAYPRVFGHVFNPASFYLCRDEGGDLKAVIVEVHNTHHERKLYTLRPQARKAAHVASMDKDHYVSPFISMDARYTVRVQDRDEKLRIVIDETEAGDPLLQASVDLRRRPLTDGALLRALVRFPFVTLKTIIAIHWHALHLWRKGARFHSHGTAEADRREVLARRSSIADLSSSR